MDEEQKRKTEVALRHLALVKLELEAIGKLLFDSPDGAMHGDHLDGTVQRVETLGKAITSALAEGDSDTLTWEDRLRGKPYRKLIGETPIKIIPTQEQLALTHRLYHKGEITEEEFKERKRTKQEMRPHYHETPGLPYRPLTPLPKEPEGWKLYNAPGVCAFCGSLTCSGYCVK